LLDIVVKNERFEPHPVSGEVEIDWENEVEVTYKRVDEETLQSLVSLRDLGLGVKLIWCVNDELGGGDGWRIGEVAVLDQSNTSEKWGQKTIASAESIFSSHQSQQNLLSSYNQRNGTNSLLTPEAEADDEDDADYWAQYDNTPARTPAPKHSPAPPAMTINNGLGGDLRAHIDGANGTEEGEEEYYKQYSTVQPAMDNHDPDEAAQNGPVESSLGKDDIITAELTQQQNHFPPPLEEDMEWTEGLKQPRPGSSGSSGSDTVAKLERRAAAAQREREVSDVGIRQHIGTSVKSLYRLARGAGIERGEFERLVRTELECLGLMDEDD
jgi:hypothetical protein